MRCALRVARPARPLLGRRCLTVRALAPSPAAVQRLLATDFLLPDPAVQVTPIRPEGFALVRDDLLHPLLGGNKQRKLDGLWPSLASQASDVVTCGGLQSAHTLAVAAACAEHGKLCHLLVRGERPAVPTGIHLYARMLAHRTVYVPRSEYADREAMFAGYVRQLRQEQQQQQQQQQQQGSAGPEAPPPTSAPSDSSSSSSGERAIAVIPEGAAEPAALLGLIRLVAWLSGDPRSPLSGSSSSNRSSVHGGGGGRRCHFVVDSGTGATATGLALGAALLGLPWQVTGVMLAGERAYYQQQQRELTAAFSEQYGLALLAADTAAAETGQSPAAAAAAAAAAGGEAAATAAAALEEQLQRGVAERLRWVPRATPRKFGRVLPGDVAACRAVAQRHGVLLDPIWSLAAWEVSCQLAREQQQGQTASSAAGSGASSSGAGDAVGSRGEALGGAEAAEGPLVVMLHTGGALGLCGLAQRFPDQF